MTSRTVGGIVKPYSYSDPAHKDAPTSYNGTNYTYDANGSQVGTSAGRSRLLQSARSGWGHGRRAEPPPTIR